MGKSRKNESEEKQPGCVIPAAAPAVITDADSIINPDILDLITQYLDDDHAYAQGLTLFGNLTKVYAREAAIELFRNNLTAAEALIEKHPAILSSVVSVTAHRGKLFGGTLSRLYAEHAAFCLLYGDTVTAENVIKSWLDKTKNRSVLYEVVATTDRHGNKVKGVLLQIAALANEFNPFEKMQEHYGIVERWQRGYPVTEAHQLLAETRPPGWENDTAARMQPYIDAFTTLRNDIIATPNTPDYETLETACANHIKTFQTTLANIPETQDVITTGLIFDPQILATALKLFVEKIRDLGGFRSHKSALLAVYGLGGLEDRASVCDLQALHQGVYYVANRKLPDCTLHFMDGTPPALSGLGFSIFLDEFGADLNEAATLDNGNMLSWLQNFAREKTTTQQQAVPQPDDPATRWCVIS